MVVDRVSGGRPHISFRSLYVLQAEGPQTERQVLRQIFSIMCRYAPLRDTPGRCRDGAPIGARRIRFGTALCRVKWARVKCGHVFAL